MANCALPLAAFAFCAWAVYLGGLASVQQMCSGDSFSAMGDGFQGGWECKKIYGYCWFVMSAEFVLVIGLAALASKNMVSAHKIGLTGLFAVVTMLFIEQSRIWMPIEEMAWQFGYNVHRVRTVVAGSIMTAVANGLITLVLGMECEKCCEYKAKDQEKPAAPAGEAQA